MYIYKHFIPENTAPKGAKRIGVYNADGKRICTVPLGRMAHPTGELIYKAGLLSDTHVYPYKPGPMKQDVKLENALRYFEDAGCAFVIICGDLTAGGFYRGNSAADAYYDEAQMRNYAAACKTVGIPVYSIFGNHENYLGKSIADVIAGLKSGSLTGTAMTDEEIKEAFGITTESFETFEHEGDLYILVNEVHSTLPMSNTDYERLRETLAANTDKRCFVFVHSFLNNDSGNANNVQGNCLFDVWEANRKGITAEFMAMMAQYPNAILFHGHSHLKFEWQAVDKNANYTHRNGFHSVHIPSSGAPRIILNGGTATTEDNDGSEGYIVEVYDNCIVLNGLDFASEKPVPLGVYKLDTALQAVEADTFTDSTGIIVT